MKNSRDGKSYSTNLAYTPPEYLRNGKSIPLASFMNTPCQYICSFLVIYTYKLHLLMSSLQSLVHETLDLFRFSIVLSWLSLS